MHVRARVRVYPFLAVKSRRFITGILPGTSSQRVEYRSNALVGQRDRDRPDRQSLLCSDAWPGPYDGHTTDTQQSGISAPCVQLLCAA